MRLCKDSSEIDIHLRMIALALLLHSTVGASEHRYATLQVCPFLIGGTILASNEVRGSRSQRTQELNIRRELMTLSLRIPVHSRYDDHLSEPNHSWLQPGSHSLRRAGTNARREANVLPQYFDLRILSRMCDLSVYRCDQLDIDRSCADSGLAA